MPTYSNNGNKVLLDLSPVLRPAVIAVATDDEWAKIITTALTQSSHSRLASKDDQR